MLKLRAEQMAAFSSAASERHVQSVLTYVRDRYPDYVKTIPLDEALGRIRWGLQLAGKAGVTDSRAAALFTVLLFGAGPTFYVHPACKSRLKNPRLHPNERVQSLFAASEEIPWDEIRAARDESAWQTIAAAPQAR
jgi:hypothetical protein